MVARAGQPNFPLNLPGQGKKANGCGLIIVAVRQREEPENRVSPASPARALAPFQSPIADRVCSLHLTLLSQTVEEHLGGLSPHLCSLSTDSCSCPQGPQAQG